MARHHTVPQFYLRNFADAGDQLLFVSRDDTSLSHRSSVRNAVAEVGFYRIETAELERDEDRASFNPESVEAALSSLEAEWAPVISGLATGRITALDEWLWYRLVQFAAVQTVRGNRWRHDFAALATQSVRVSYIQNLTDDRIRASLAEQGKAAGDIEVAAFRSEIIDHFPRIIPPQAVMVQESLRMALGEPDSHNIGLAQYLADKKVDFIRPEAVPVLTSDEPVCWWSAGTEPIGYATAQVIWLPISPKLIVQFLEDGVDLVAQGLPDIAGPGGHDLMATEINRRVASQAERWIIHHPSDDPLTGVTLPAREQWVDELIDEQKNGDSRRELWRHRRK